MIAIKMDKELAARFGLTLLSVDKTMVLSEIFVIEGNKVYLRLEDRNSLILVDLLEGKLTGLEFGGNKETIDNAYEISEKDVLWGMCNMINNAIQQWLKCTKYLGPEICEELSMKASGALTQYGMSLSLTEKDMKVFKDGKVITYEEAFNLLLI